jgi:putative peptidoglycan lipid II flippase
MPKNSVRKTQKSKSIENHSESAESQPEADIQVEAIPVAIAGEREDGLEPLSIAVPVDEAPPEIPETSGTQETARMPETPGERRHIVKSATLVMLGNLGSSVMGMVRQIVVAYFGPNIAGPFLTAIVPSRTFNDILINGHVNGALIPVFSDYTEAEKKEELRRLVYTLVNLVLIVMIVSSFAFLFLSQWFIQQIAPGYNHLIVLSGHTMNQLDITVLFAQIIFFSLLALGPFAVLQAALFARKEFGWPSVATSSYHVGIILGAIVGAFLGVRYMGYLGLSVGVVVGSFGEVALLIPGLRSQRLPYMFVLDLKHPALRRISSLYVPILISFAVSAFFIFLDQRWTTQAPGDPAANNAAMRLATTLIQFPGGLVATALSVAVLPTLAEHARNMDMERFKSTLLLGFRLGLLLMIPAAAGLIVLRLPIVTLIFQHGSYSYKDSLLTAIALQNYAYQLPFIAIDQLLLSAYYARKNTITPVIVGIVSFGGYLVVAIPFRSTIGMPALVFANTVQNSIHPIILIVLLRLTIGPLRIRELIPATLKIFLATVAMVAVAWGLLALFAPIPLFSLHHLKGQFLTVIVVGLVASAVYFGGVLLLKVEEVGLIKTIVLAKIGKR